MIYSCEDCLKKEKDRKSDLGIGLFVQSTKLFRSVAGERAPLTACAQMRIPQSGILPGEEKVRAISATSVIGTDITPSGNTPLATRAVARSAYSPPKERKTDHKSGLFFFGRGIGIRTPKYRVRVCCVTVTPFPYFVYTIARRVSCLHILSH